MVVSDLQTKIESLLKPWEGVKRVHGLKGGAQAYLLSLIAGKTDQPLLIITPTMREAEGLFSDLAFFLGEKRSLSPLEKRLHLLPAWEVLPFERLSPHPNQVAARLEGLYYLSEGQAPILISTPAAMMQKVLPKESLKQSYLYLVKGQEISRERLLEHLVSWGFQNAPLVEERGDFSVRGGIVDIFPPAYSRPVRLEFFGDRIDSIREFNPSTQRSETQREELLLLPAKEFSLRRGQIEGIVREIDRRAAELEIGRKEKNSILESLGEGIPFAGMEFFVPYFYPALAPIFSYLPPDTMIWLDEADQVEAEVERFKNLTWQRGAKAKEEGRLAPPVETLYLSEKEWQEGISSFSQARSEPLDLTTPREELLSSFLTVKTFPNTDLHQEISSLQGKEPSLAPLVSRLKEWAEERIFFVAPTSGDAGRLKELLAHYEVEFPLVDRPFPELLADKMRRAVLIGDLTQGFRLPEDHLILVTSDEIFATKKSQQARGRKGHPSHFISSLSELKQNDYVVHLDHGIGIYRGLKFLSVAQVEGEFLHLEYEGGDRLYLPVDRINLIQRYIGGDGAQPSLDRLGGSSWEKVKAKTRESILAMARELLEVYAAREVGEGHAFPPPDYLCREFEASFPFEDRKSVV